MKYTGPSTRVLRGLVCVGLVAGFATVWPVATAANPSVDLDTDGDLLPDQWEQSWGLNPNDPGDAELDPDGDRLSTRDEYFAGTSPTAYTAAGAMSERQLLDLFKGKAFVYFWEQSRPPYHFTPDKANYNDPADFTDNFNSIATTGFAIISYVVADDRGWVSHELAYQRIRMLLARAVALQDPAYDKVGVPSGSQGNRHGYLFHFVANDGFRNPGSEISTIDHALFVAGALVAAEYYKGTEVEQLARQLFLNTDWNWLYDGTFLYQGWKEDANGTIEGGKGLDSWNRYSELMVLLFLAMGHPDAANAIPATAWDHLTYGTGRMFPYEYAHLVPGSAPQNFAFVPSMPSTINEPGYTNSATEFHYIHAGSLHNHQYSHLFADFRSRRDRYQTDFFANSISATRANRQFCINLNAYAFPDGSGQAQPYETYGPDSWGIMAGIPSFTGYAVLQPIVMSWDNFSPSNIALNNDSGTVVLSAALGSTPFTPRQTVDFTRNMLSRFQANQPGFDALVGRYGFRNAFNLGRTYSGQFGHFPSETIGLDLGPAVGSVENFESGLVWKFVMRNDYLRQGMQAAGFATGAVEPFILNFDDNPPAPHEDPNGGGQDPNSFGGTSYAWGNASVAYEWIDDPLPSVPFGPQYWAQRISVFDGTASGAFALLKNHSVSHWGRLSFWIRGDTGQESFEVGLKDAVMDRLGSSLQASEVKLPIAAYHPAGAITTQWTEVRIPLRAFADGGVRMTELDNLSFTNAGPGGGTIHVDDIAFLGDEFAPQAPTGLSAATNGTSVALAWLPSVESDVVGYRVWRSDDGGSTFVPLNSLLAVGTTSTDAGVPPGAHLYRLTAVDNAQPANESAPSQAVSVVVNAPPVLDPIGNKTVNEGQLLTFNISATDPNGDPLTYSASGLPPGASFDALTRTFSWTPGFDQAGGFSVTFAVSDGKLEDSETILINVLNINRAPTANAGPDQTVPGGTAVSLDGSGSSDVDGDALTYAWTQTSGPAVTLSNPAGVQPTFTAPTVVGPTALVFTLMVSDGALSASDTVTITVQAAVQTPWQTNAYGTLSTNRSYNYAMGYHFTPQVSGQITKLGGFFNGTKTVKLFNKSTGALLASATVTASNTWGYTNLSTPVSVTAGTTYTVAVYLAGSGGSSRSSLSPSLPRTFGDIRITGSTYTSTSENTNARPTNTITSTMYGQADIGFVPSSSPPPPPTGLQTPWQTNAYGTLSTNRSYNYAMGYHFTPQVNGQITKLGGFFNGTKTVKLFNKATGALLASATVTATNTWGYTNLSTPVNVTAGTTYTVAVYLAGSGGSYRSGLSPALPRTFGDIRIQGSTYVYTASNPTARPTNTITSTMYGQADIGFIR